MEWKRFGRGIGVVVDGVSDGIKWLGFLVFALAGVLVVEVTLRYVFHSPTDWAHEIAVYLFGSLFMLGGVYGLHTKSHVNVEIAYERAPARIRFVLDCLACIFILIVCIVLIWHGGKLGWSSMLARERTPHPITFQTPVYILRLMIPVAGFLTGCQAIVQIIRSFKLHILRKKG